MGRWLIVLAVCTGCRVDLDDWEVNRVADGTRVFEEQPLMLVVAQPMAVALTLQSHESNYYYAPDNVRFTVDHATWLDVTVGSEIELPMMRGATQIDLTATMLGGNRIRFISDSTDEPLSIMISAVAP